MYGSSMNRWGVLILVPAALVAGAWVLYATSQGWHQQGWQWLVIPGTLLFISVFSALIASTSGRLGTAITVTVALIVVGLAGVWLGVVWYVGGLTSNGWEWPGSF